MWNVETGEEIRRFTGHTAEVRGVAVSTDSKYIVTTSFHGSAWLWLTDIRNTIGAVCALLTRDLTSEERVQFDISNQDPTCPTK